MFKKFKEFAFKGNVIDMAVGVIIGTAFGKIVTSLVNDIIMPIFGHFMAGTKFTDLKYELGAEEGSAILYGNFIQNIVDFFIIAISIFIFVTIINKAKTKFEKKEEIVALKKLHSEAEVLVHPECNEDVTKLAEYIGSTTGIIKYAKQSKCKEFIVATEIGVLHELQKENPDKKFYFPESTPICEDMKRITLEKILHVLETEENQMQVDVKQADPAKTTLSRMLELAR